MKSFSYLLLATAYAAVATNGKQSSYTPPNNLDDLSSSSTAYAKEVLKQLQEEYRVSPITTGTPKNNYTSPLEYYQKVLNKTASTIEYTETPYKNKGGSGNPAFCKLLVTKIKNCTIPISTVDVPRVVAFLPPKTCSTSTSPECKTESLNKLLIKSGGLKAAYCNDKFLIIHSDGTPNHDDSISQVEQPIQIQTKLIGNDNERQKQGDDDFCQIRKTLRHFNAFKIPLNPIQLVNSDSSNNADSFSKNNITRLVDKNSGEVFGIPLKGPIGVTISGIKIFPVHDEDGFFARRKCRLDRCGGTIRSDLTYGYSGDSSGGNETSTKCLYGDANYNGTDFLGHPPHIGWAIDGFKIHGLYKNTASPGFNVTLDDCGGHFHDGSYHYHSQAIQVTESDDKFNYNYTAFTHGPFKCFKGNLSAIPNFWNSKTNRVSFITDSTGKDLESYQMKYANTTDPKIISEYIAKITNQNPGYLDFLKCNGTSDGYESYDVLAARIADLGYSSSFAAPRIDSKIALIVTLVCLFLFA